MYNPVTSNCEDSASVDCHNRHCSDPASCPCVDYDEELQQECGRESFEEFYPDMSDCASFLNCTGGCIEKVVVGKISNTVRRHLH